jgi:hydrogenase-4 membrane subunit HyfE
VTGAATLAAAFSLCLSFACLSTGRTLIGLRIVTLQALTAALAVAAQALAQHSASLLLAAVLAFGLNGIVLPIALRRLIGPATIAHRCGLIASAAAAFALVAVSTAAVMQLTEGPPLELLALALSVLLLGLLLPALRSHRLIPAVGLLMSQNGIVLATGAIPGLPLSVLFLAAIPLVPSVLAVSVWLHDRNRLAVALP